MPLYAYADCDCGLSGAQAERLKTRAHDRLEWPILRLQIVDAQVVSTDPNAVQGRVVGRGPFGIKTAEVRLANQEDIARSFRKELLAWSLFAVGVAAPLYWLHRSMMTA